MATNNNLPSPVSKIDSSKLDNATTELVQKIIDEDSPSESQDLIQLFNYYINKKSVIRLDKLNSLQEKIVDQMIERVDKRSGEISTVDLLNYLNTVGNTIEKTQKQLNSTDNQPTIQQNNTQINIGVVDGFDSDSKDKIAAALKAILGGDAESDSGAPTIIVEPEETIEENPTEDNQ